MSSLVNSILSADAAELAKSLLESGQLRLKRICVERKVAGFGIIVETGFIYSGIELEMGIGMVTNGRVPFTTFGSLLAELLPLMLDNRRDFVMSPPVLAELLEIDFFEKYGVELRKVLVMAIAWRLLECLDAQRYRSLDISGWDRLHVTVEVVIPGEGETDY